MDTFSRTFAPTLVLVAALAAGCAKSPISPTAPTESGSGTLASTVTASTALRTFTVTESGPVAAGTTLTYQYTVTNTSAGTLTQVLVIDSFPAGFQLTGFGANDNCGRTNARGFSRFTCNLGDLAPGATRTATAFVVPETPGTFVTSPQTSGGLVVSVTTAVTPGATDVQISASVPGGNAGAPLVMTYQIKNSGNRPAMAAALNDTLPSGVSAISATSSVGTCTISGANVHCDLGDLAASTQALVTLTVVANAAGEYSNTAVVSMSNSDSQPANNAVTHVIKVR